MFNSKEIAILEKRLSYLEKNLDSAYTLIRGLDKYTSELKKETNVKINLLTEHLGVKFHEPVSGLTLVSTQKDDK